MNPAFKGGLVADKDWFVEQYTNQKKSLRDVAQAAGCASRTAARWAKQHGIEVRTSKEGRNLASRSGPDNPMWKGGPPKCACCGATISWRRAKCSACYTSSLSGENNPNFKGLGPKGTWKKYYEANKTKIKVKSSTRRARKLNAVPLWADQFVIKEIYELAQLRTRMTGVAWHVDHIVPLQSKLVCGLHVEHNLRVILGAENLKKSNKHDL
jgi:hypothetical protein